MGVENKLDHTEDEDDLEALRLAALNSLKKKNGSSESIPKQDFPILPHNNFKNSFRGGKRRFFPGTSGRGNRNGQHISSRNPNLISIPTSAPDSDEIDARTKKFASKDNEPPKLILPQDRYSNKMTQESENDGQSSKFDRYNNSNSESEDDDEIPDAKLERCDSLEALMEELDAEIMGESLTDRKAKVKKVSNSEEKKSEVIKEEDKKYDEISVDSNEQEAISVEVIKHEKSPPKDIPESSQEKTENIVKDDVKVARNFVNKSNLPKSPIQKKNQHRRLKNGRVFKPLPPVINPIMIPNQPFLNVLPAPQFTTVYNTVPSYSIHEPFPLNVPPPFIQPHMVPLDVPPVGFNVPPLQPLVIQPQDPVPMGPLSPRSAAFVLQNRAIVEKRKRSPRRSFSRSPSPLSRRVRYSKSPGRSHSPTRRSLSPVRRPFSPLQRTTSPRRSPARRSLSPFRRNRDKSPRRESPRKSPRRQRNSPKNTRESPKRIKESRRTPIKDRLGNKSKNDDKEIAAKEVSSTSSKKSDPKPLDPVLEARKKKFECKEINVKERVIRLKPKEDSASKNNEAKPQNVEIDKKSKMDEIKPKQVLEKPTSVQKEENNRIVLLPKNETKIESRTLTPEEPQKDQLEDAINELEMLLKDDEALELSAKVDDLFTDDELEENESKKTKNTDDRLLMNGTYKKSSEKKKESKNKWKFEDTKKELSKSKKIKKEPLTNPIENRKIEIKIRNPSKYEKNGNSTGQGSLQSLNTRTVELAKKDTFSEEDSEPEIIEEEEEEEIEVTANREGDLRAQLSRKRAERQNKLPCVEGVQSRLLQSALEGAVFKTKKSKRKDKEPKDVKLPIHLRLGIAHDSDMFTESVVSEKISRKKSKKRKYADMEQV